MFKLIEGKTNAFQLLNEKNNPQISLVERLQDRLMVVRNLFEQHGRPLSFLNPKIRARIFADPFHMIPHSHREGSVAIPALCLLDRNELPGHLCVTDPLDSRLNEPEWFNQFVEWLNEHLGTSIKTPNFLEKENFRLYVKFMQDPEKASKAIRFILGHELGHIVNRHEGGDPLPGKTALISAAVLGTGLSYAYFNKLTPANLCFGALVGMASMMGLRALSYLQDYHQREKLADRFSFKIHPSAAEGAIYLFETLRSHYQMVKKNLSPSGSWQEYLINHLWITSDGEIRGMNWTHGSFQERIKRAQSHLDKQSSTALHPQLVNVLIKD